MGVRWGTIGKLTSVVMEPPFFVFDVETYSGVEKD
jgi:hypothetical protein